MKYKLVRNNKSKYTLVYRHKFEQFEQFGGADLLMDEVYYDTLAVFSKFEVDDIETFEGNKLILEIFKEMNIRYYNIHSMMWTQDLLKIFRSGSGYSITILETHYIESIKRTLKTAIDTYYGVNNPKPSIDFKDHHISDHHISDPLDQSGINLAKGGNYIGLPIILGNKHQLQLNIDLSSGYCRFGPSICLKNYNIFDFDKNNQNIIHIDEIACVMPYGPSESDFKLWLYKPNLNTSNISESDKSIIIANYLINFKTIAGFIGKDKIVTIPLKYISSTTIAVPVFNRICLKNGKRYHFIFPLVDPDITQIVNQEMEKISESFKLSAKSIASAQSVVSDTPTQSIVSAQSVASVSSDQSAASISPAVSVTSISPTTSVSSDAADAPITSFQLDYDIKHTFIDTSSLHQLNGNLHCFYKTMGALTI